MPAPDPWAPEPTDVPAVADPWTSEGANGAPAPPAPVNGELWAEPWPAGSAPAEATGASPWPAGQWAIGNGGGAGNGDGSNGADGGSGVVWPSTWPSAEPPPELPAWAQPPPPTPQGPERPPELDELPAWYTDPLPNGNGYANGGAPATPPPAVPGRPAWDTPPPAWWQPGGTAPGPAPAPPAPAPPSLAPPPVADGHRSCEPQAANPPTPLPGAGDELRSLFGAVVGEAKAPAPPAPPAPPAAPTEPPAAAGSGWMGHDPLGPPVERPPIDMSRLDAAFGPPPGRAAAPPAPAATAAAPAAPPLPRRTPGASAPAGAPSMRRAGSALDTHDDWPAAGEPEPWPEPVRPTAPAATFAPPTASSSPKALRPSRAGGLYVPPADEPTGATAPGRTPSGSATGAKAPPTTPAALPVIVLVVLVVVLIVGVAWLVIAGDDAGAPASDSVGTPANAPVPSAVTATDTPDGVQVTWHGDASASYVVTVLTTSEPPRALPPAQGTSMLVAKAGASAPPQCFTVAAAAPQPDQEPGPASDVACIAGANPDAMVRE